MKKILLMIAVALSSLMALAQERTITGTVVDKSAHAVMPMVTVQLLKSDSSYVAGALSNDSGRFVLQAPAESNTYIVKLSSIGYKPLLQTHRLSVNSEKLIVGLFQVSEVFGCPDAVNFRYAVR